MGKILQFPFSRMPRKYILEQAAELAVESPDEVIVMEPVGDCAVVMVAGCELWFSVEEFSDLLLLWSQKLSDHAIQLAAAERDADDGR